MKPIELKVSGLHSFREEQTVDFLSLSEAGVFGIFGPTGSGKSSLLDAITLSLYGKVERAAKNTQGIMNHAEEKLSVSFTFELKKNPIEQYRVERMYRRTKEDGLKIGHCRLIKIGDSLEVLADKERDVTQAVQELLGLTHEDFTRAVVLPQGKFSEFLTLKGTDRRKMLQRLFHLEKYGDALNEQLKHKIGSLSVRVKEIIAEQQGLGDASKETLKHYAQAHKQASEELAALKKEWLSSEQNFQFLKEKWKMQQEWDHCQSELSEVDAKQDEMDAMEKQATSGEKAAGVMPILEEWQNLAKSIKDMDSEIKDKQKQLNSLADETEKAKDKASQSKLEREKLEPELQLSLSNYKEGKRIQTAYNRDKLVLSEIEKALHDGNKKLEAVTKKVDSQQKERQTIVEQMKTHELNIRQLTVSFEERQKVQQAIQDKHQIETGDQQLEEYRVNWKSIQGKAKRVETLKKDALTNQIEWQKNGQNLFKKTGVSYDLLASKKISLEQAESWMAEKSSQLQIEQRAFEEKALSLKLVHTLEDGKPCPVCGSTEHPAPSSDESLSSQKLEQERETVQKVTKNLIDGKQRVDRLTDRLEQNANRLESYLSEVPEPALQLSEEPHEKLAELSLEQWVEKAQEWSTAIKAAEQDTLQIQEQSEHWIKQGTPIVQKIETMTNETAFYKNQVDQLVEKAEARKKQLEEKKSEWQKQYESMNYETLETLWTAIQEKDKQADLLKRQLDGQSNKIEKCAAEIEQLESDKRDITNRLSELKGSSEAQKTAINNYLSELEKLSVRLEDPFEKWMKEIEEKRTALKTIETESEAAYRNLEIEKSENEKLMTRLQTTHEHLQDRQLVVGKQLENAKKEAGFTINDEITEAYLPKDRLDHLKIVLKEYHEKRTQLTHQMDRIKILLGGKRFSQEQFDQSKTLFEQSQQSYESGLQREAQLQSEWENLNKKAERYEQLDQEKKQQEDQLSTHLELQKLFKGNIFVEFVAEEQLHHICVAASKRLGDLTRSRYALEVDSAGGFIIRDDANGGIKRPVSSLSGGETFLTSLALALSLSEQIQLTGDVPLQFFFLDEGFGTLDQELLDTVVTALEKLHMNQLSIGIISHVPELQERLPKKIMVTPAESGGQGSRIKMAVH